MMEMMKLKLWTKFQPSLTAVRILFCKSSSFIPPLSLSIHQILSTPSLWYPSPSVLNLCKLKLSSIQLKMMRGEPLSSSQGPCWLPLFTLLATSISLGRLSILPILSHLDFTMNGFVLPPFVSTSILKDKDLICVKRKGVKLVDVIKECRERTTQLEHNIVEKQTLNPCVQLLLNEELGKETSSYKCENEEGEDKKETDVFHEENVPNGDVPVKRRKASKELKSSKYALSM